MQWHVIPWKVIDVNKYLYVRNSKNFYFPSLIQNSTEIMSITKKLYNVTKHLPFFTMWFKKLQCNIVKNEWKRTEPFIIWYQPHLL